MTSTIKVDNIQDQDGNNIINENSNTITIGASGDTVTLASGASQSGFGRTGTVDWQTTPKTGNFTGVNGEGYFINTTSSAITMTLPSASAGHIISIQDYNNTFDTNAFTIQAGSGVKINGGTAAGQLVLNTEGQGLTLIYVDATVGWRSIESTTFNTQSLIPSFITATGGTITTVCTDFKVHTFTGPGTFTVCSVGNPLGSNTVSYMVVAGGGGGGGTSTPPGSYSAGGGGGGGGFRESKASSDCYSASPLNATCGPTFNLPVSAQGYPITVGGGGAGGPGTGNGTVGVNSVFSSITSAGGGFGNSRGATASAGDGGSGGGGSGNTPDPAGAAAGTGNTPPVSPPQGNNGGAGTVGPYPVTAANAGGGGGATAVGQAASVPKGGDGGAGATTNIPGSPISKAGGGGGGAYVCGHSGPAGSGAGGAGGGAAGGCSPGALGPSNGSSAAANTGGGGGGGQTVGPDNTARGGGTGGSGIVVIRYKFQ